MTLIEIFDLAVKQKSESYEFYLGRLNLVKNALSKEVLKRLADDESFHLQRIREGYEQLKKGENFTNEFREGLRKSSREYFDSIFSEAIKHQIDAAIAETSEFEIVQKAMELETKNHRFFIEKEKEVGDKKIKEFFDFLACEEYRHYNLLYNTYEFISHPNAEWSYPAGKNNEKDHGI